MGALWIAAGLLVHAAPAWAQSDVELDAAAAQRIVAGCADHASARGQSHAIAVVDPTGSIVAFLRMDRNTPGVADFALEKARAAAHWHFTTEGMAEAAVETPGFARAPRVVTVAGGVPIYSPDGARFLGAVGVSGEAPSDDAACAGAGIVAAGFRVQRG
jgi:uncharacterized protein GlcG (DUF336 family)